MAHVLASELRKSVLQAAFQGKLTTKDVSDGNVWTALSNLNETKQKLIKQKKIKKEPSLSALNDDEIPYDIPDHWAWVKIGEIIDCGSGSTPLKGHPEYYSNGTIPWLKTGELNNSFITNCEEKITEEAFNKGSFRVNKPGDILVAMYGATIGKLGICTFDITTNQACLGCTPYSLLNNIYLFHYFKSAKDALVGKAEGGAQPNISRIKVRNHPIPLPPIEEQARIVARVDELMAKIDEYEKLEKELTELKEKFPGEMRDAVIHDALQGRITSQMVEDSKISKLLQSNSEKRDFLIKDKKIKFDSIIPIKEEEIPYDVPNNWEWIRLSELFTVLNGDRGKNYPSKATLKKEGKIPFISALNLNGKCVNEDDKLLYLSDEQYDKLSAGKLLKNDIVMCIRGSLGKHGVFQFEKGAIASSLVIIRPISNVVLPEYLFYYLDSDVMHSEMRKYNNGTAQPNLSADSLKKFIIPFPPIEEQQRIVDKLDKLLPMCDELVNLC